MEILINYWAVLISAIVSIAIGAYWYGPLFGKKWMHLAGLTKEGMKSMKMTATKAMMLGALTALVMSFVFAHVLSVMSLVTGEFGIMAGLSGAFWMWLGFIVPVTGGVYLWEGKSIKLWVINAGYYLVSLGVMGIILSSWI